MSHTGKLSVVQMSGESLEIDMASLPSGWRAQDLKRLLSRKLSCPTFRLTLLDGHTAIDSRDGWHDMGKPLQLSVVQAAPVATVHDFCGDLLEAVSGGDVLAVEEILAKGQCPDTLTFGGETVLFAAARNGYLDVVQALLDAGASLHRRIGGWFTPLYIASWQGHLDVVRLFVEHGADPGEGLCAAAFRGHIAVVQFLLDSGADVNLEDEHGQVPLKIACAAGHLEIARLLILFLLRHGMEMQTDGLLHAAVRGGHLEVAHFLLQLGADMYGVDDAGDTPLEVAAGAGDLAMVELLESAGIDTSPSRGCHDSTMPCRNPVFQERHVWMTPLRT
ncbi:Ankyrin repeat domain-containing protein 17 [Symbiodinium microadriaticum]|uniref:Ankyrin repeat domain-containing protein 17 n=1 Tax=Symbiodinium microadriaticum TaxID=2951 RepID=A0A1Q9EFI6_SYMMI|nr:Ankyrin repeat domain-containing protein 17 [Symbiodinium microadriaticum]CAE7412981.1 Kidins220 [Symbiodinium sp. KB8]